MQILSENITRILSEGEQTRVVKATFTASMNDALNKLVDKLETWVENFIAMLPNLVIAIILLTITLLLARSVKGLTEKWLHRFISNRTITSVLISIFQITVVLLGIFVVLSVLNLDKTVTSLLAGVGIIGLAFGFAFKETASNFISGIYMAFKSPINEGDILQYDDYYGHVKKVGLRATTILTLQGQDVVIPNRLFFENSFTHFTVNGERRIDLNVGISYGDDLEKAEKVTIDAIKQIEFLKPARPIDLFYVEFGNSSINFIIRYWVNFAKETDYLRALSEGIKSIKKAYDANNITITFPIRTLDFGIKGGTTLAEMIKQVQVKNE